MAVFRKNFNCCKTVSCKNFGVIESDDYVYKSERLGYWATECRACGSHPPWIKNTVVNAVFDEKFAYQFGRKLTGCPQCNDCFFLTEETQAKLNGFTSAGTQRKKCIQCQHVFTVAKIKNKEALNHVLNAVLAKTELNESIKNTGLSARLYYFYLDKLALIFSNFSRLNEEKSLHKQKMAMTTQGKLLHFSHQRGIYHLITAEVESGYILLQTNNLTKQKISDYYSYDEKENTIITSIDSDNLENVIIERYQQHMKRNHFEQLLVGELKPVSKCRLIYPDKLTYVHFQLLNVFVEHVDTYIHYIEHESCFRSAALMAAYPDIKAGSANVCFFIPFKNANDFSQGKEMGWWKDKWFSDNSGGYSPIVNQQNISEDIKRPLGDSVDLFADYLQQRLYQGVNSMAVIDNLSEIHRTIFNYCELSSHATTANKLAITDRVYTPETLLDEALQLIMNR
ncbi:hypothetical protein ACR30L_03435 [Psychromonas sp. PT13]|uniref:hypothetical protein n=1 Tax=Psychromonas sp. PT13 TaxID=3439547 RepID=UPI003EB6B5ED